MAVSYIAIDFDCLQTNIYKLGCGIVLSEPTVCAVETDGKNGIKAIGYEAKKLIGKTAENTKIVFPIFEGEIVNAEIAGKLLLSFLRKIGIKSKLQSVEAVIKVPCGISAESLSAYREVVKSSGIDKAHFIEAPILSALGARVPLNGFAPYFVIDIAGGTTNIAALSLDGIIAGISINLGVNKLTTDIIDFVAESHGLQIGLLTAERLRKEIGALSCDSLASIVNGRDIKTGVPKSISLTVSDINEVVKTFYDKIWEYASSVLVKLPPEVSAEIRHVGLYVSGCGADAYGIDKYYAEKFGMKINVPENPDMAVALGGGIAVGNTAILSKIELKKV